MEEQEREEERGQRRRCLTGWLNHQLGRHPGGSQARVTDLLWDLRDGLLLLSLLEVLVPGLQVAREEAVGLRRNRLANLATVLATLQRERVAVRATPEELEGGEEVTILRLGWALVRRWLFQAVCLGTGLSPAPGPDTLLLAWVRSVPGLQHTTDLTDQWTDGSALCHLALHHGVSPSCLTAALERPSARRLDTVLQTLHTQRLLPPGLLSAVDMLEGRLDRLCSITGLLCLFQALRPSITPAMVEGVPGTPDPALAPPPSPARHLPVLQGTPDLAAWSGLLEEVLSWLLEAEDRLLSLHSLGQRQLEKVRQRFYNHEDFMLELREHQGAVRKVRWWWWWSDRDGLNMVRESRGETSEPDDHRSEQCSVVSIWKVKHFPVRFIDPFL